MSSYFLDTNILVYAFDTSQPKKQTICRDLIRNALNKGNGCVSYQVIQEFLNIATRKFAKPLSASDSQNYLTNVLEPLCEVFSSIGLYHQALEISSRWQFSFYDSLIIAAALCAKCNIFYTEDLQHEQEIENLKILNPFLEV